MARDTLVDIVRDMTVLLRDLSRALLEYAVPHNDALPSFQWEFSRLADRLDDIDGEGR